MEPVASIMRDGQHGSLPMNGEIHMALSLLNVSLLSETEPLKVIDYGVRARRMHQGYLFVEVAPLPPPPLPKGQRKNSSSVP